MVIEASHGSQRQAVRSNATGVPFSLNPLKWASWGIFLVSAISEYGFDIDFPLTPTLWLAISVCIILVTCIPRTAIGTVVICSIATTAIVALVATRHSDICGRQHHRHRSTPSPQTQHVRLFRAKPKRTKDDAHSGPPIEPGIVELASLSRGGQRAEMFLALTRFTSAVDCFSSATTRGPPRLGDEQPIASDALVSPTSCPSLSSSCLVPTTITEQGTTPRSYSWRPL